MIISWFQVFIHLYLLPLLAPMNPKRITMNNPATPITISAMAPFIRSGDSRCSQLDGVAVGIGLGGGEGVGEGRGVALGSRLVAVASCTSTTAAMLVKVGLIATPWMIFNSCPT